MIIKCTFLKNFAKNNGGALYFYNIYGGWLDRNNFTENSAQV